jgi:hypothetical protein
MNLDKYITEYIKFSINNDNKNYKIVNEFEEINDQYNDVFSIIIYYLDTKLCKIITRRLDNDSGWGKDLKINLFSVDKKNKQTISIGSNNRNTKIIEIHTNIELEKDNIINNTTKIIIQAKLNNSFDNHRQYLNFTDLIYNNNNIDYLFFNDMEQRKFIKNNFMNYLEKYDLLSTCNVKYIIFICCYIYLNGGLFIHPDISLFNYISNINTKNNYSLDQNNELLFLDSEKNNNEIINYLDYLLNNRFNNSIQISKKYTFFSLIEFNNFKSFKNYLPSQNNFTQISSRFSNKSKQSDANNNELSKQIIEGIISDTKILNQGDCEGFQNIMTFKINKYKFIIDSDIEYNILYLDENYYLLKPTNKYNIIEKNLFIKYIDEEKDYISYMEVKTDNNNYKTNNVFFFTIAN